MKRCPVDNCECLENQVSDGYDDVLSVLGGISNGGVVCEKQIICMYINVHFT
jgi:hypothetical protein